MVGLRVETRRRHHHPAAARRAAHVPLRATSHSVKGFRNLQPILDKAATKLSGWQGDLMNNGGRRELVKTVLSSLLTYLLTPLKPPKKFYKDMDKMQRKFLGAGNKQLHGGKCKTAWPRICRPLNRSGLGIADLECFGRSLRLRWLWHQSTSPKKTVLWHRPAD
jgi:hypothetical protein